MTKKPPATDLNEQYTSEINPRDLAHNLVDLYWLIQIVDAGSFSEAANNHGLSKSNLSRRISQLESRLGVRLLHRNPRFLTLTTIGSEVYRHGLEMITAAQKATNSVQRALQTPSGRVNLVVPAIISSWLMPVLANFNQAYPQVLLSLQTADATQDINSQSIDLALSLFEAPDDSSQIVARPLATLTFANFASTTFKQSEELREIQVNNSPEPLTQVFNGSLQVSNYRNALEAVLAGFGYAYLPVFACHTGLSKGDLMYYDNHEDSRTLYAFTQPHRGITLAARVLLDYLTLHISQSKTQGISPVSQPLGVSAS